jgi:hypothetical protein
MNRWSLRFGVFGRTLFLNAVKYAQASAIVGIVGSQLPREDI